MDTDLYEPPVAKLVDENNNDEIQLYELKAFIGSNDKFYLRRWRQIKSQEYFSFNAGAFFLTGAWMLYRKMYKCAIIFTLVAIAEMLIAEYVFINHLNYSKIPLGYDILSTVLYAVIIGKTGNYLYYIHTISTIKKVKEISFGKTDYIEELRDKGGRSLVSVIVGTVIIFLTILAVLTAYDYFTGAIQF